MKNTLKSLTIVVVGGALGFVMLTAAALVTGAQPWHTDPNPEATAAAGATQIFPMVAEVHAQEAPEVLGGMAMGKEMMCGGICGDMMAQHQETAKLIEQLVTSFAAIEGENDPAVLKSKLTDHGTLLKQLQTKSQESMRAVESMMGKMRDNKMTCPMMTGMKDGMIKQPAMKE